MPNVATTSCNRPYLKATLLLFVLAVCTLAASSSTDAQIPDNTSYRQITEVPRFEVDRWVKHEVGLSSSHWEASRYSIYVGFQTDTFASDPYSALAMKRLAFSLLNNTFARGDVVTPFYWDNGPIHVGKPSILDLGLTGRKKFVLQMPNTPLDDKMGTPDQTDALRQLLTKFIPRAELAHSIILMFSKAPGPGNAGRSLPNISKLSKVLAASSFRIGQAQQFKLTGPNRVELIQAIACLPVQLVGIREASLEPRYPVASLISWQPTGDSPLRTEKLPNPTVKITLRVMTVSMTPTVVGGGGRAISAEAPTPLDDLVSPKVTIPVLSIALVFSIGAQYRSRRKRLITQTIGSSSEVDDNEAATLPTKHNIFSVTINNVSLDIQTVVDGSEWNIDVNSMGEYKLTPFELQTSSVGRPDTVMKLSVGSSATLWVQATNGTELLEREGTAAANSNSTLLIVERGRNVACILHNSSINLSTRLEINYDDGKMQGSMD